MVSAGMQLVKYLLFIFNFVFWVTGIAILGLGIAAKLHYNHYIKFAGHTFLSIPILFIVIGCIVIVIAFFGCCGAIRENHCMIVTFSVLLGLIFILQLSAGIAAYVFRNDLESLIQKGMKKGIEEYGQSEDYTKLWDQVQHDFNCCGMNNKTDWHELNNKHFGEGQTPDSCCETDKIKCGQDRRTPKHKEGCYHKVFDWSDKTAYIAGGVGIGIAVVQIIGIIFACCLASAIKREYETV